jgi:tetratricopeptide (TPR) repeat protein
MNLKHNLSFAGGFCVAIILLCISLIVSAQNSSQQYSKANKAYMEQDYQAAIEQYEKLISGNSKTAEIYYNLGNSYYKIGEIASAILNYERALKLNPSDPDIEYNLRIAYLATIDKIEPAPMVFYERWWNEFVNGGSVNYRAWVTVILLWCALTFAVIYLFSSKIIIRKLMFFGTLVVLAAGIFTWYLTNAQYQHLNNHKGAIIFTDSAYVKSSPDSNSSNLFMLHSGTKIEVIDELKDWKKVRIANGNEGWIEKEALALI